MRDDIALDQAGQDDRAMTLNQAIEYALGAREDA